MKKFLVLLAILPLALVVFYKDEGFVPGTLLAFTTIVIVGILFRSYREITRKFFH